MHDFFATVPSDEWHGIAMDFEAAKSHMQFTLAVKADCWNRLPWKLMGLCHHDVQQSKKCAAECLRIFDATPAHLVSCHHHVTLQFLGQADASSWRSQVAAFAGGQPFHELPVEFQVAVGSFLFVPIVERVIEARHKDVKHGLSGKPRFSEVTVSLPLRLPMLETRFQSQGGDVVFKEFCCAVDLLRNPKAIAAQFGMEHHPLLTSMKNMRSVGVLKLIRQITYRSDLETQFQDHSGAAATNALAHQSKLWKKTHIKPQVAD